MRVRPSGSREEKNRGAGGNDVLRKKSQRPTRMVNVYVLMKGGRKVTI